MIPYVISGLAGLVAWACSASEEKPEEQGNKTHSFSDATSRLGEPIFSDVAAAGDFNGDHFVDLVVGTGHDPRRPTMPHLLLNDGKGYFSRAELQFQSFSQSLQTFLDYTSAAAVADLDGDARDDIVMGGINGEIWLFRNQGFSEEGLEVNPIQLRENREDPDFGQPSRVTAFLPWDFDGDGKLGIGAGNGFIGPPFQDSLPYPRDIVLLNRGEDHYQDISTELPFTAVSGTCAMSAVTMLGEQTPSYLLHTAIDGDIDRFHRCRMTGNLPDCSRLPDPDSKKDGMGSAFVIMNRDPFTVRSFSTYNNENGLFEYSNGMMNNLSANLIMMDRPNIGWGVVAGDFQNRGAVDFIYGEGMPVDLTKLAIYSSSVTLPQTLNYMSQEGPFYVEKPYGKYFDREHADSLMSEINNGSPSWYNLVIIDANNDGCLDLLVLSWRQFLLERYPDLEVAFGEKDYGKVLAAWSGAAVYATPITLLLGSCNEDIFHWITVTPPAYKENSACIGCVVVVEAEGKEYIRQVGGQSGTGGTSQLTPVHIGLGIKDRIERVTVIFPDGTTESHENISPNSHVNLR